MIEEAYELVDAIERADTDFFAPYKRAIRLFAEDKRKSFLYVLR